MFTYEVKVKQKSLLQSGAVIKVLKIEYKQKEEVFTKNLFFKFETEKQTRTECKSCKFFMFCKKIKLDIAKSKKENLMFFMTKVEVEIRKQLCEQKKLNIKLDEIDLSLKIIMEESL